MQAELAGRQPDVACSIVSLRACLYSVIPTKEAKRPHGVNPFLCHGIRSISLTTFVSVGMTHKTKIRKNKSGRSKYSTARLLASLVKGGGPLAVVGFPIPLARYAHFPPLQGGRGQVICVLPHTRYMPYGHSIYAYGVRYIANANSICPADVIGKIILQLVMCLIAHLESCFVHSQ